MNSWHGPGRNVGRRLAFGLVTLVVFGVALGALGTIFLGGGPRRPWLIGLVVGAVVLVAGRARRPVRYVWQPIGRLIDGTERLARGEPGVRVDESGPPPMRAVMRSFNTMAIRLEEEDARRRRLLNDLGHELRTPLSVLRGEIEAMRDGVHRPSPAGFESMLDDVATMERLLADLRTLALTEAGRLELHPETTDLATLVTDAVSSFALLAEDHGVSIRVLTPQPVDEIDIDPVRIRQVVSNLIDNALRHLPEGGAVTVAVRPGPGTVVVTVSDDGPGIPADLLDSIFDRFTKGADSSGSGLGLSIARDLVEAHGGSVTAVNRERGAMFTVTLPAG